MPVTLTPIITETDMPYPDDYGHDHDHGHGHDHDHDRFYTEHDGTLDVYGDPDGYHDDPDGDDDGPF